MPNNYRLRVNPDEPSSNDIRRRMDFDGLLARYEEQRQSARPPRLRRLAFLVSAAAAAVLLLLLFAGPYLRGPQPAPATSEFFAQRPYVERPLPHLPSPATKSRTLAAHSGGVIDFPSGSRLVVPASAFMDDKGRLVGGDVQVHYRELYDYVDFFVSGIPLAYDSAGLYRYLESAGMVEVYAEQEGQRLRLAPGKAIQVELVSEVPVRDFISLPQYSVYQLDTAAHQWVYQRVDLAEWLDAPPSGLTPDHPAYALNQLHDRQQGRLTDLLKQYPRPEPPVRPEAASGNYPTLELNFLTGDLELAPDSELSAEDLARLDNNAIWEILPESGEVDTRAFNVTWEQVRLRGMTNNRYELTLIHSQNQERLIVRPVLLGNDYQRALQRYQQAQAEYETALPEWETTVEAVREQLQTRFEQEKAALRDSLSRTGQDEQPLLRRLVHRFVIHEFGYWTCALPHTLDAPSVEVTYTDTEGESFNNLTAYLVPKNQNTLLRFVAAPGAELALAPESLYLLWVVDEGKQIAYTRQSGRLAGNAGDERRELVLRRGPARLQSEADVRELLSF